jgi:hypothetical protein
MIEASADPNLARSRAPLIAPPHCHGGLQCCPFAEAPRRHPDPEDATGKDPYRGQAQVCWPTRRNGYAQFQMTYVELHEGRRHRSRRDLPAKTVCKEPPNPLRLKGLIQARFAEISNGFNKRHISTNLGVVGSNPARCAIHSKVHSGHMGNGSYRRHRVVERGSRLLKISSALPMYKLRFGTRSL